MCRLTDTMLNWERGAVQKTSEWRQYGAKIQIGDSHNKYCYVFETKIGRPDFNVILLFADKEIPGASHARYHPCHKKH